ncbi:MAG: GDSL-type esterase/lipase family protein [Candidatus Bathyarchaeia archaeon]
MKLRIVGLGDSTTAGTPGFLSPLEAPPNGRGNPESQYAYWMMRMHPEWTVLNRGVNGERSDEILARFERDVFSESPNYVVILAGVNDVYQGAPVESVKEHLLAMYEKTTAAKIRPVAATVLPYNAASAGESKAISDLNTWIAVTANRLGALFCDTNRAVRDPGNPDRLLSSPDGNHPDVSGYRKLGEALAATIDSDARLV